MSQETRVKFILTPENEVLVLIYTPDSEEDGLMNLCMTPQEAAEFALALCKCAETAMERQDAQKRLAPATPTHIIPTTLN